ncbi:MAG: carbohydrate ABC transporter permease [Oscillospiraceae bacterium]|jgi:multiple sugar transport system permease protein|nr:carbohydrate ABC transporter permease [Oscillospiraceae bacterium]
MNIFGKTGRWIAFAFLTALAFFWLFPVAWMLINAFRTDSDFITSFTNIRGSIDYLRRMIPKPFTIVNFIEMFLGGGGANTTSGLDRMFRNSFVVSISQMVLVVFITSLSAYAYERLHFPGGGVLFWALMYMSMFPNAVSILPMFKIANSLGWVNNLNALIWPGLAGVFNIFLLRNFLKGVPLDFDEAAKIDGANSFQVYYKIIVPMIAPALIIVGLFSFNGAWNDFLWPTIVMTDANNQTLTAGLRLLFGQYEQKWAHMIASCVMSMIPPFLLYLLAQRYFLQGIAIQAGVKG